MEALNSLDNIIQLKGNDSEEWNTLLNLLRDDRNQ